MSNITIVYTDVFDFLLNNLITYLADFSSEVQVIDRIERAINRFEDIVTVDPSAISVSPSLLELGVVDFREFHADNFRIVYRIHPLKEKTIVVDVIAQQKQNLEELLIQFCLLYQR